MNENNERTRALVLKVAELEKENKALRSKNNELYDLVRAATNKIESICESSDYLLEALDKERARLRLRMRTMAWLSLAAIGISGLLCVLSI